MKSPSRSAARRVTRVLAVALAVGSVSAQTATAAGPVGQTTAASTRASAALSAFAACKTSACRRTAIVRIGRVAKGGFDAINRNRTRGEQPCDAVWATGTQWALVAMSDARAAAGQAGTGDLPPRVGRLLTAARKRLALATNTRSLCRAGTSPAPAGRFAACLREAPGTNCILVHFATVKPGEERSRKPQLVTRLTCAGRPFRAHWELQVDGRALTKSAPFLACLSRTHEDLAATLDVATMGFAVDSRLTNRTFKATLRIMDDDLGRSEGSTSYTVSFSPPAGGQYSAGVPGAWVIDAIER